MKLPMLRFLFVVTVAGCSFHGMSSAVESATPADADVSADAAIDGKPPIDGAILVNAVPCTGPQTGLVACYELEDGVDDGVLADSSANHFDATTSGLTPAMHGSSHAATVGAASMTYTPTTSMFDRAAGYTEMMWVNPVTLPDTGEAYGLLDHELQYAMALVTDNGDNIESRCIHTMSSYEFTASPLPNKWSLLACTWDGTNLCAMRWTASNDHERNCFVPGVAPAATGMHGLAIGHLSTAGSAHDQFDGAIDSIHLYDHALMSSEVCAAAGQASNCLPCDQCD